MWKAAAGTNAKLPTVKSAVNTQNDDDEWETDPDYINNVTEEEQRWGGGRTVGAIDMSALREQTAKEDSEIKKKLMAQAPQASYGYGGKFGIQQDRMDKSAVGHEHIEKVEKHASQKDYASGFGGKFGVQKDRMDKSAVGHDYIAKVEKHESQTDYAKGFGGKFGVQNDRVDKSAVGWDYQEKLQKHESQTDYSKGFGGKFGVQTDRQDAAAVGFDDEQGHVGTNYEKSKPVVTEKGKASSLKSRFENLAAENKKSAEAAPPVKSVRPSSNKLASKFEAQIQAQQSTQPPVPAPSAAPVAKKWPPVEQPKAPEPTPVVQPKAVTPPPSVPEPVRVPSQPIQVAEIVQEEPNIEPERSPSPQPMTETVRAELHTVQEEEDTYETPDWSVRDTAIIHQQIDETPEEQDWNDDGGNVYENTEIATVAPLEETEAVVTGISAIALYDYQADADDEISFDPDDIITNIEMIDEGWWRGECKGQVGLFPANYVQLQQ